MENKKQTITAPSYIKKFSCIGGTCEDTCCAGWHIAIDEETYKKYKKVKDKTMQARLNKELVQKKSEISKEHVAKIKLKNGRCAFLNKEDWCDIYSQLGESYLSHTCTLYPRTINKINDTLEYSMTFSCPEACRHILLAPEGIKFEQLKEGWQVQTISADIQLEVKGVRWQDYLLELRSWMIELVQDRSYPLETRLYLLRKEAKKLNQIILQGGVKKIKQTLKQLKQDRVAPNQVSYVEDEMRVSKEAIALAKYLENFSKEKKLKSDRYMACLKETLVGLGFDEEGQIVLEEAKMLYIKGINQYYKPFLDEKSYILENYLVNYIFERCIPLDGDTLLESYERMTLYYKLIRVHLVGLANHNQGLTDEKIVKFIQSFSKVFDHNDEYFKGVLEFSRYIE